VRDVQRGAEQRFRTVLEKKNYAVEDTRAGRDFVAAYVEFMHCVERVYDATAAHATEGALGSGQHGVPGHEHQTAEPWQTTTPTLSHPAGRLPDLHSDVHPGVR
jgi:hypothetical protein